MKFMFRFFNGFGMCLEHQPVFDYDAYFAAATKDPENTKEDDFMNDFIIILTVACFKLMFLFKSA